MKTILLSLLLGTHSVDLSWNPSNTPGITYSVYRSAAIDKPFKIVRQGLNVTKWTNKNLRANKSFCYRITAVDSQQKESMPTDTVCVVTPA